MHCARQSLIIAACALAGASDLRTHVSAGACAVEQSTTNETHLSTDAHAAIRQNQQSGTSHSTIRYDKVNKIGLHNVRKPRIWWGISNLARDQNRKLTKEKQKWQQTSTKSGKCSGVHQASMVGTNRKPYKFREFQLFWYQQSGTVGTALLYGTNSITMWSAVTSAVSDCRWGRNSHPLRWIP